MSIKFKAQLIEDKKYYRFKMIFTIISLCFIPFIYTPWFDAITENLYSTNLVFLALTIVLVIVSIFYSSKIRNKFLQGNYIEIFENEILLKNKKNELIEDIKISDIDEIFLTANFNPYAKSLKEFLKEMIGTGNPKYIELKFKKEEKTRRFDIILDSHFMESQLKKLLREWRLKNLKINMEVLRKTSQHSVA